MSNDTTLEVEKVTRVFGDLKALDEVSFSVRGGRLTGFVGANGAGKTTAMRVVLGILKANSGQVTFGGKPINAATRRSIGYMPEERGLYPKMKISEQLTFLGEVHGLTRSEAKSRAVALLTQLGLGERTQDTLQKLSLGNQQRVQLAAALLHTPAMLILDEPFSGLDPLAVDAMTELLRARADADTPVLFSSHQLDLVERLCDDVVIIDQGRVVAAGSADELRASRGGRRYRIVLDGGDVNGLRQVPGVIGFEREHANSAVLELAPDADDQVVLRAGIELGAVRSFTQVEASLSEIFREAVMK